MPQHKPNSRRRTNADRPGPSSEEPKVRTAPPRSRRTPFEESLDLWSHFSQQTGETVTDYLRRFGEEQQRNYETWATSLRDATRATERERELKEVRARFDEWNRRAEEVGSRIREAFQKTVAPQRELFELWVKPLLPKEANDGDRSREAMELVQKLWSGLTTDVSRRMFSALQPGAGVDQLVRVQEESLKEFTDSFQKLVQIYFTSPAFVTMFGRTLDSSLERQNVWNAQEDLFSRMTGLPTKREVVELSDAVHDLSEKVNRMNSGRA